MDGISITFPPFLPSCFRLIVWEISSCPDVESHKAEDTWDEATAVNFSGAHIKRAFVSDLSCGFGRGEEAVLMDKVVEMMRVRPRDRRCRFGGIESEKAVSLCCPQVRALSICSYLHSIRKGNLACHPLHRSIFLSFAPLTVCCPCAVVLFGMHRCFALLISFY